MLEASIIIQKEILFVYIACEVRISCKGHLAPFCMIFLTSKTNFMNFQTAPVGCLQADVSIEYVTTPVSLTESVFM